MDILIRHMSDTFNYGSMMMGINLISHLNKNLNKTINFYIDATEDVHVERMREATGLNSINKYDFKKYLGQNKIKKIINSLKEAKHSQNYDAVVVIGGDDLSEYYGKLSFINSAIKSFVINKKTKIFLLGQTIGPFSGKTEKFAKYILNPLEIYTRDPKCIEYLRKNLGLKNVKEARDLAFINLPGQEKLNDKMIKKYDLEKENYVTLVPSGIHKKYTLNYEEYINSWVELINKLSKKDELKKIIILAHVVGKKANSDIYVIKDIINKLTVDTKLKLKVIEETLLPLEAREILGNGKYTITGRMHAAISTFEMRKPAISLSYSIKYEGVIGKGLDMQDLIIESAQDTLWKNRKIVSLVMDKVEYIEENYEKIIEKIDLNVNYCEKMTKGMLDDITVKINGK